MKNTINRLVYRSVLNIRIIFLWIFWYPRYFLKVNKLKKTLDYLNYGIPSFSERFPFLNSKTFIKHCKYWVHWVRKMDPRERLYFKEWNPYLLINEEEGVHIDLSTDEMPILNYIFYFPDSEWIPQNIFSSLTELRDYFKNSNDTAELFISKVYKNAKSRTMSRTQARIKKSKAGPILIADGNGIRLSPEFLSKRDYNSK